MYASTGLNWGVFSACMYHVCLCVCMRATCVWMSDWLQHYDSQHTVALRWIFAGGLLEGFTNQSVPLILLVSPPVIPLSSCFFKIKSSLEPYRRQLFIPCDAPQSVFACEVHQGCIWLGKKCWNHGKFLSMAPFEADVINCNVSIFHYRYAWLKVMFWCLLEEFSLSFTFKVIPSSPVIKLKVT